MARTLLGAVVEMLKRELASRLHRDVVLELETGPATSDQIASISEELRREFPKMTWFAAGGDVKVSWKVSVRVRPDGYAKAWLDGLPRMNCSCVSIPCANVRCGAPPNERCSRRALVLMNSCESSESVAVSQFQMPSSGRSLAAELGR